MHYVKKYVEVVARISENGEPKPMYIGWEDNRYFKVDKVLEVLPAASLKAGGQGLRFKLRIGQATTYVFYENPAWFVEKRVD
ncbi:hypothetical protein [Eubacterium limosum]|uniref:hypothetical protein n=2 Tax=Eubacterium TaxID=1730 RepID=UPI001063DA83|nr:hypothetical protein [Eubacterium limosum]